MDHHSRAPKKNTSYRNEVLPQDATHLIERPCHQRGSLCQDQAGNWTTRRPRSGQNHLARHSERGKKRRQRERWKDNNREWTGLHLAKSQKAVENREKWRKLVMKSSVVPLLPSRLTDIWWWSWWSWNSCHWHVSKQHQKAYFVLFRNWAWDSAYISTSTAAVFFPACGFVKTSAIS